MRSEKAFTTKLLLWSPVLGMSVFILFYVLATFKYPGGSYTDYSQMGFSWQHNYLCDLLDSDAVNGAPNPASTTSRIGLGFLCFGISTLWYLIPQLFPKNKFTYIVIRAAGIGSMLTVIFLAYGAHDLVVRIAGILGLLALLITFKALYDSRYHGLLVYGIISLLLVAANFYIYESRNGSYWLPLLQKFTFLSCMGWFLLLNVKLLQKS